MRVLSCFMAVAMLAVFLLPSTIAIYAAVNGTAWDLQDLQDLKVIPLVELFVALAVGFVFATPASRVFSALHPQISHPIVSAVPLFELDCALIC